jgi:hypothetical protein
VAGEPSTGVRQVSHLLVGARLDPILLRKPGSVERGLTVSCPICRELPGKPCQIEDGKPVVHDARESIAFNGRKIWT